MLGELEAEVMSVVWARHEVTVKDVAAQLARERAYNTVQTTLERLLRKGLLVRKKQSHAFVYCAVRTRDDYHRDLVANLVEQLLPNDGAPILAAFVDAAAKANPKHLDALEQLIERKRAAKRRR